MLKKETSVIEMSLVKTLAGPGEPFICYLCKHSALGGAVPGAEPAMLQIGQGMAFTDFCTYFLPGFYYQWRYY